MLNIAICDDECLQIEYLSALLKKWAENFHTEININTYDSAESFLFQYAENKSDDILLLDIQMKEMDGVELAKKIRSENESMQIVFITGFADFIAEGYEVSALHYLMKPVKEEKLFEVLNKAKSRLKQQEKSLLFSVEGENVRIPISDILYFESFGHNTNIITKKRRFDARVSFAELEKQLDNSFVRCHRSYIVNIRQIKSITKTDVILDNQKAIPLSRRLYHEVNQAFIKYFKGEL